MVNGIGFRRNRAHVRLVGIKDGGAAAGPSAEAGEETHRLLHAVCAKWGQTGGPG